MLGRPEGSDPSVAEHHGVGSWCTWSAALLTLALLLGACGSSSTKTVTAAQTTPSSSSSATATTSSTPAGSASSTSAMTSSTTTAAGPPRCTAAVLVGSFLGQQGAAGHGELGFALRNTGAHSCRTVGFPGVLFLGTGGHPLPTVSTRTTHDLFGPAPVVELVLAPGSSASFRLGVTHGINSSAGCTTASALQVIPPDDTATLRIAIPGGAYQCGTATVSPLRPGTSAYP